ncbi:MAG: DUF1127 domain-containing protein [Geminicoccaceae bacterium]
MNSQNCIDTIPSPSTPLPFGLPPWITGAFRRLGHWAEARRQRQHLAMLDERLLRDIGISRADVEIEIKKPFWHA